MKKEPNVSDFTHTHKKNLKVLMKIDEMADVFLNSANYAKHALLTFVPPKSIDQGSKS